jgi:hypothetical protein
MINALLHRYHMIFGQNESRVHTVIIIPCLGSILGPNPVTFVWHFNKAKLKRQSNNVYLFLYLARSSLDYGAKSER